MKAGLSSEFAIGFDEVLTSDELEFMLDDLLFQNPQPDMVQDFLGAPLDTFDDRNVDDLISELQDHPLVRASNVKSKQDKLLSEMGPGKLTKEERSEHFKELDNLSKEQDDILRNSEIVLIYRTQQDGKVDDIICLPLEGEVFMKNDPNRPIIPRGQHPGCRCYWEDAITGENLGQF